MAINIFPPEDLLISDYIFVDMKRYVPSEVYDTSEKAVGMKSHPIHFTGSGANAAEVLDIYQGPTAGDVRRIDTVIADGSGDFTFDTTLDLGVNYLIAVSQTDPLRTSSLILKAYHWLLLLTVQAEEYSDIWDRLKQVYQNNFIEDGEDFEGDSIVTSSTALWSQYGFFYPVSAPDGWTLAEYKTLLEVVIDATYNSETLSAVRDVSYAFTGVYPCVREWFRQRHTNFATGGKLFVNTPPSLRWYVTNGAWPWAGSSAVDPQWLKWRYASGTADPNETYWIFSDETENADGYNEVQSATANPGCEVFRIAQFTTDGAKIDSIDDQGRFGQGVMLLTESTRRSVVEISFSVNPATEVKTYLHNVLGKVKPASRLLLITYAGDATVYRV